MRKPFLKNFLSFFWEQHLESAPSEINPHLYISLNKGRYQLSTANAIYSYEDKYDNFYQIFSMLDWNKMDVSECLILGFGLGSIPVMLENNFQKKFSYTGVEIDESVIYLASKYVLDDIRSPIELIQSDAHIFVQQSNRTFDLINMDVFLDDLVPEQFKNKPFLIQLKNMLTDNGVLIFNKLASTEEDRKLSNEFFEKFFLPVFPEAEIVEVKGNYLLVNRKDCLA